MKQTEIGLIPDDWEVKSLGEILTIKHGYGFEGDSFSAEDNGFIVVTPGNFKLNGGFQKPQASIFYIGKYPKEFNLKPNDLVIMMTDLSKESDTLGNPAIIPDDNYQYLHNQRIGLINCNSDNFDKNYLFHLLCSKDYHKAVVSTAAGSTVKHTSPKRIYTIKLPITQNLQEQQRIAKALSDVDALISTTEKLIQKKKNIKQGAMQNLLTGKKRLPGFGPQTKYPTYKQTELGLIPEDWEVKALNELINDISDGPFGSNLKTEHYTTEREVRIIQLSNVGEDGWDNENVKYTTFTHAKEIQRCIVPYGSIVIAKMMPAGRAILCPNKEKMYILGSDCVRISPNNLLDSLFFMYFSKTSFYLNQIKENTQGSTRARTSVSKLKRIEIALPSKEEQTAIANVLSSMDKEIETLNTKLEKYRNLKTAMMQQLLTGKVRLVK